MVTLVSWVDLHHMLNALNIFYRIASNRSPPKRPINFSTLRQLLGSLGKEARKDYFNRKEGRISFRGALIPREDRRLIQLVLDIQTFRQNYQVRLSPQDQVL